MSLSNLEPKTVKTTFELFAFQKIEDTKILQKMYNNASLDSSKLFKTKHTDNPFIRPYKTIYYKPLPCSPLPGVSSKLTHACITTFRSHLPITYMNLSGYLPTLAKTPQKPSKSKHLYDLKQILPIISAPEGDRFDYKEGFYSNRTCKTRSWYERYEVYGAEFVKVNMKKAFRVVKNSH